MRHIAKLACFAVLAHAALLAKAATLSDDPLASASQLTLLQAISATLAHHPLLGIQQQQVESSKGDRMQASSRFDLGFQSGLQQSRTTTPLTEYNQLAAIQSGIVANAQNANLTTLSAGMSKLFRNGISIEPYVSSTRNTDNLYNLPGANQTSANLTITFPMMRGRGREVVAAQEKSARLEQGATDLDLKFVAAQLATKTAISYWDLVSAERKLDIAKRSENRGTAMLENVQALVNADRTPRAELNNVLANMASRSATRIAVEQQVIAARVGLGQDMGLNPADIYTVGKPVTDFPKPSEKLALPADSGALSYYLSEALQSRADYRASRLRLDEADSLIGSAKNQLLPQVDFSFTAGFSSLREGTQLDRWFVSPFSGVHGPNAIGGLSYSFSHANDFALGQSAKIYANRRQSELRALETARTISAAIAVAAEGVSHARDRLQRAEEAVTAYEAALAGENEKYRLGLGSVIDLLTVEDRLTNGLIDRVGAQYAYSIAIINFRFATGTLVSLDTVQTLNEDTFQSLPFQDKTIPSSRVLSPKVEISTLGAVK